VLVIRVAIPAAALALVLAGCGGDSGTPEQRKRVERVVLDFAAAEDRRACDLMTVEGLERVYGLDDAQPAYWNCVEASDKFQGQRIEIDETEFGEGIGATVKASTVDDDRLYRVKLKRISGDWLIHDIAEE
jgi:hypothetical protein